MVTRTSPDGATLLLRTLSTAHCSDCTASVVRSSSARPASVSSTRRVERRNSGSPTCRSSSLSALLTEGGVISSLRAAGVMPPSCAMAWKMRIWL